MKKFKRRTIAIVSMMTMLFSISVYGATDTMTAVSVDRSVESKWDLSLTETYMGNNMPPKKSLKWHFRKYPIA